MDISKTPPSKRKARASLGTAIKRSIQTTRKDPGSAGKKRRVVVATQKNIARALDNEKSDSNESKIGSSVYEGRITRARNATLNNAHKETPSRMLRQLSKVLPRPLTERTPRRNSIRAGAQRTPASVRLTPNSTRRSTKKPNNKSKISVTSKKQSPQDLLRQLARAPGFVQVPQDVPDKIRVSNINPGEVESKQEKNLPENIGKPGQDNVQIQQSFQDDEPMDIETQLHDKIDNSDDEIPNYFDQLTETMEFTGEVITDQNNMGIEFNDQVKIQPPDEIFNRFREQVFDDSADNNVIVDASNSPIADSSRLQEGNELDNFWLGRNLNELNNLTFENDFNAIGINESSERRNRLLNELLRSSLDYQDSENYISHDNFLEKQSNEIRVQSLFNSKKYDIENIISLDPLINESIQPENSSKHDIHVPIINYDIENEATVDDVELYHELENNIGIIQDESEEVSQEESVNEPVLEFDNDHLNLEQGLNDIQRNKRMRFVLDKLLSFL
ncbi:hypothetical protein C1645_183473 [Glomus cerebriforme]|uniref:Uncharacterized protein n=1 Tax=Glomus cerebriforme TaxID=658196 RepID=A0A397T167_9GLOM|nr:hypothetical protein C1645_183473 [Glomus cerebriforme]